VLPYGLRKIQALRTLTTESTAVLIPFRAQEIMQPNGLYYGQNAVSKNMIVADRRLLLNGNSFRLGVSGSGKSMSAKEEIVQIALSTEDDILILDPESEFGYLTEALGGEVIRISATSDTHINALDMDRAYGDERNPIVSKSEFVLSLFEQLIGDGMVTAKEKSILGRCTEQVYLPYIRNGYKGTPPTLQDFYRLLQMQPEPEAQGLALSSELFITGTLNTFARHTNVDTQARIIAYDIRELGEQLMPLGMLVTLDAIYNRVIQNWKKGRRTWIFCDEFYILFRYEYSANFFYKLWKRIRKYNGLVTGLTQNVDELLRSDTARLMLANSEFLVMLNQSATGRAELAKLLNISDNQLGYVTNVPAGCGLIRCAGNIVPFTNSFPKDTKLYKLMSTKLGLMLHASVLENATIIGLREKIKGFFVNIKKFPPLIEPLLKELRVKTPSVWTEAVYLSGGNQQKVVLAKWLYAEQDIYIFDEPTRGIDVNAKAEFYKQMSNLTKQGKCILMISSDMPELISMSDRVLVVRDGRIDCELKGEQINEQEIIKRALGVNKDG